MVCVCTDVGVSTRVLVRLWLCGRQRYGSACVDRLLLPKAPSAFSPRPIPGKEFQPN